jgi:signal peptidase
MAKVSSITGLIIFVLLAPLIVMNVTLIVKSYLAPDKVPDFFGIKPFVVLSDSMKPHINNGDLVFTKTVNPADLKVNDVISYRMGEIVITHRIFKLAEKNGEPVFITKGDAKEEADAISVAYAQVEGIQVFKIAKIGHFAMYLQTPVGMLVFIGIPMCGFIFYDTIRQKIANKKEKIQNSGKQNETAGPKAL